jgi:hypothetical protein
VVLTAVELTCSCGKACGKAFNVHAPGMIPVDQIEGKAQILTFETMDDHFHRQSKSLSQLVVTTTW